MEEKELKDELLKAHFIITYLIDDKITKEELSKRIKEIRQQRHQDYLEDQAMSM